jgi:hypothetical protein
VADGSITWVSSVRISARITGSLPRYGEVSLKWGLSLRGWAEKLCLRGQQPTGWSPEWISTRMPEPRGVVEC